VCTVAESIPLKQGLKPWTNGMGPSPFLVAESIPLKQGLKRVAIIILGLDPNVAESIPLKQGLKQILGFTEYISIKLRRAFH